MNERRPIRLLAGALAALWLALPVGAAVHGTLEAHEFCHEHQVFEHVSDSASAVSFDGSAISATTSSEEHADCSFGDALLRDATELAVAGVAVEVVHGDVATVVATESGAIVVAVLDAAPKTSPPSQLV